MDNRQEVMAKMRQRQQSRLESNRGYWWLHGFTKREGKPIVYGTFPDERALNQWAFTYTNGNYTPYLLKTKSRPEATRMIKALRLESEQIDLDDAIKPMRHRGKDLGIE